LAFADSSKSTVELRPVLKVGFSTADNFPNEYTKNGEFTGYHLGLISHIANQKGYDIEIYRLPWRRLIKMIKTGELDAVSYIGGYKVADGFSEEYYDVWQHPDIWLHTGNGLTRNGFYLMVNDTRKDIKFKGDIKELQNLRLGMLKDYNVFKWQLADDEQLNILEVESQSQLTQMLERNRLDAAIVTMPMLYRYRRGELPGFKVMHRPLKISYVYLGFSKHNFEFEFAEDFAIAMLKYRDTTDFLNFQKKFDPRKITDNDTTRAPESVK
jgi:ABC-type amino acid transport substrate-binding protein